MRQEGRGNEGSTHGLRALSPPTAPLPSAAQELLTLGESEASDALCARRHTAYGCTGLSPWAADAAERQRANRAALPHPTGTSGRDALSALCRLHSSTKSAAATTRLTWTGLRGRRCALARGPILRADPFLYRERNSNSLPLHPMLRDQPWGRCRSDPSFERRTDLLSPEHSDKASADNSAMSRKPLAPNRAYSMPDDNVSSAVRSPGPRA